MQITKKTRNQALVVVTTLLFVILIMFIVVKPNNLSFTGFVGQEDNGAGENVLLEDLNSIVQIPPNPPPTPEEEVIVSPVRENNFVSSSGGSRGNGNSPSVPPGQANQPNNNNSNSNNSNSFSNQSNNSNGNNNSITNSSKKKLKKIPFGFQLKFNGVFLNEDSEFQGKVRFGLEKQNKKISDFDVNFDNGDVDLSDIFGDSDFVSGKAFMHHGGMLENISLYVPIKSDDVAVIICSNASSYDEIYFGCSELPQITNEEILYLPNPRVTFSLDGLYYIVSGITGTGVMGANVTILNSTSANVTAPGEDPNAIAGNITELIFLTDNYGLTRSWQGYFGNVTGVITLEDGGGNVLYNWSESSPEGVILASTNDSISWDNVQCFNFTSAGNYTSESGTGGATNLFGTNLTQLESRYNINSIDKDGVDETFTLSGLGTHNLFYINNNEFEEGECINSRIFSDIGSGEDDKFEEALLYEPTTYSVIFAGLLNENVFGFDGNPHDFEMLVLEDGHGTDVLTSTYYFYTQMY